MADPLSETIALLRPRTVFTKAISGAGAWAVSYAEFGHPSFCTVVEGSCRLAVSGEDAITLEQGDFVLLPATPSFVLSGFVPAIPIPIDPHVARTPGDDLRHGTPDGEPDVRLLGGYFVIDSPDAGLLVDLLPGLIHVPGNGRLAALMALAREEALERRAGRDLILTRLVEVMIVEALRAVPGDQSPPGLLRGLADPRASVALRLMHGDPAQPWTVAELACEAALSRSAFFDRFSRAVGRPPMEYLLGWRMALAKEQLRSGEGNLAQIAERVGYQSASAFSTAFSRFVGLPPRRFARALAA